MAIQQVCLSLILAVAMMATAIIQTPAAADDLPSFIESTDSFSYGSGDILENGDYRLRLKDDCELVLLKKDEEIWSSNSRRSLLKCVVQFQPDGNLVIYSTIYVPQWASGTAREKEGHYILLLTDFGNLAIYGPVIWETKTGSEPDDGDAMLHRKVGQGLRAARRAENAVKMLDLRRFV